MTPARAAEARRELRRLAASLGVQASYVDTRGRRHAATVEGLLAAVAALGVDIRRPDDAARALRERERALAERVLEPVLVAPDGILGDVAIRLPAGRRGQGPLRASIRLEGAGDGPAWTVRGPARRRDARTGAAEPLPTGYHELHVEARGVEATAMVISAPSRAPAIAGPTWGVFVPLYAVRSSRSAGVGDLTDLSALLEWVKSLGGSVVATLPLLAAFLEDPYEPSPYSPASRLFWNELYLDLDRVPEARTAHAGASRLFATLREGTHADPRATMRAKRSVLEDAVCAMGPQRERALRRFLRERPDVSDYARFRAACERHGTPWHDWPAAERDGDLARRGRGAARYHEYVQWLAEEQLREFATTARSFGSGLYLDFPLGVNPAGYDVWREREAFATAVSAGAPPDAFFTTGQDWGFPPLHPERIREQRYRYPIACVRTLLRHASMLRIDHVMGLHRLFWIPPGIGPTEGVYVRYHADELYAILSLEAHRAGAVIVGEDLGTVPASVRPAMRRHGVHRSYVLQEEVTPDARRAARPVPRASMASVNTHDMPPFASFWRGLDLEQRRALGWLDERDERDERERRRRVREALVAFLREHGWLEGLAPPRGSVGGAAFQRRVLRACVSFLASSEADVVTVTLEDLWLETDPQNVPGTTDEHVNWRRRARHDFEAFRRRPEVVGTLRSVARVRAEKSVSG